MKRILSILSIALLFLASYSCTKVEKEVPIFHPTEEEEEEGGGSSTTLLEPKPCNNIVVAHRGGGKEAGVPENSIAALNYTMNLGCMAMECDMYWTKDNNIIIHHGSDGKVNGLHPSKCTLEQIRNAGRLSNGEQIPTLDEFITKMMTNPNCCTKLWIETKNITNSELTSTEQTQAITNGLNRAIEIIQLMKADKFVEFNGTGRSAVFKVIYPVATSKGFTMAYASGSGTTAQSMKANGWNWSNYDVSSMNATQISDLVKSYKQAGIQLSIYCLDSDALRSAGKANQADLKGMLTNYPAKLLNALK